MEFYPDEIHKLAKKHKKLLEKYFINPGGCMINNHEFYWVNYLRFEKLVGVAVISPSNVTDIDEYKQAFYYLSKSSQLRSNLSTDGGFRANINMSSFKVMEKFLATILEKIDLKNDRQIVVDCHKSMQDILTLQERIVELFNSYYQKEIKFHEGTEKFDTNEYLEFVLDCTCEIDYNQFTQLNLQYEAIPKFEYIREMINKNNNIKEYIDYEVKVYLKEFINSRVDLIKNIKKVTYTPEITNKLSKNQHMELGRKILLRSVENVANETLSDLRFPQLK